MAQEDLIPLNERTKEEQKRITTMGGKASGEARRRRKTLKEELLLLLEEGDTQKKVSTALIEKCFHGDVNAIRELATLINERSEEQKVDTTVEVKMSKEIDNLSK